MTASEAPAPKSVPSIGSLLSETTTFLFSNSGLLYGYAAWLLIPVVIILGASFLGQTVNDAVSFIGGIALFALSLWATAAMTLAIAALKRPDLLPKDAQGSLSQIAWQRAPTLMWISILTGGMEIFGFLLFIIPGILLTVWFTFAETEAVLTGAGTFLSLDQSRQRVRGNFWRILLSFLVLWILLFAMVFIIFIPILFVSGVTDANTILIDSPAWMNAIFSCLEIFIMPITLTYTLHLYFSLRTP